MPEIKPHDWQWYAEQIVWGLLVGLPVVATVLMLYWLAQGD